jgi:hypothetical protein
MVHPFTCGSGNRTDENHLDGEGVLVATENGWICPFCSYTQNYAFKMMLTYKADPEMLKLLGKFKNEAKFKS